MARTVVVGIAAAAAAVLGMALGARADAGAGSESYLVPGSTAKQLVPAAYFVETFDDEGWTSRWTKSAGTKIVNDKEVLAFDGEWAVEVPSYRPVNASTPALTVKTAARHHGISARLANPIDFSAGDKPFVLQYEVRSQEAISCGGSYVKLLTASEAFTSESLNDKTPYTIMFGPDKCGNSGKIHFIVRHENPVTHVVSEHHFKNVNYPGDTTKARLLTLIVRPDETFTILLDQETVKSGNLLTDLDPPINPPKTINDPTDLKPADWVDAEKGASRPREPPVDARIPDPTTTKPDDWDEDAPRMIEDADAVKPEDWNEEEPTMVPDSTTPKPAEWSDEDDGDWEAPLVPAAAVDAPANPKCAAISGCGEWHRPKKANPAYKGKWKAPLVANPAYKGPFIPRQIPNPEYFEDPTPHKFSAITEGAQQRGVRPADQGAVAFDIWTMQANIQFDNILITNSPEEASAFAEKTWRPKYILEIKLEEELKKTPEKGIVEQVQAYATQAWTQVSRFAETFQRQLNSFADAAQKDPIAAVQRYPTVAGTIVVVPLIFALVVAAIFTSGSPVPPAPRPRADRPAAPAATSAATPAAPSPAEAAPAAPSEAAAASTSSSAQPAASEATTARRTRSTRIAD